MLRAFLLSSSGKFQAIFIIGATLFSAFASATLFGLCFDTHQLVSNTDLISSVYQVMGTVYAILLTFTLWGVWQNFTEANASVQNEVYALLDLVHIWEAAPHIKNVQLRHAAFLYCTEVIEQEWPLLKNYNTALINRRESSHSITLSVTHAVQQIAPEGERENILFSQVLNMLTRWLDARRTRLLIARGDSARAVWPLLFTGAIVLFAFNGLFVAKTIAIWSSLLFGISLVIGVTFYLIFSLDCPFAGTLSVDSEPFTLAIDLLKNKSTLENN